jgi:hypothetical protein
MENRIKDVLIWNRRQNPAQAEVGISVYTEKLTSTTNIQGRLVGPRCPYTSTVEVSYPLREANRQYESTGVPHISTRIVIPEPCLWDPESPFVYHCWIELRQEAKSCDQRPMNLGFRSITLGSSGIRVNSRLFPIRGVRIREWTEEQLLGLHKLGCNALYAPVDHRAEALWDLADRLGFLMIGRLSTWDSGMLPRILTDHPSCLGWVIGAAALEDPSLRRMLEALGNCSPILPSEQHWGFEPHGDPLELHLDKPHFVVCEEEFAARQGLPRIILKNSQFQDDEETREAIPPAGTLGWICTNV